MQRHCSWPKLGVCLMQNLIPVKGTCLPMTSLLGRLELELFSTSHTDNLLNFKNSVAHFPIASST